MWPDSCFEDPRHGERVWGCWGACAFTRMASPWHMSHGPGTCRWSHGSCTLHGACRASGEVAGDTCPMTASTFHGHCTSDPRGVIAFLSLLSPVGPSFMPSPASQLPPYLIELLCWTPLSFVLVRGVWGRQGGVVSWFHAPFPKQSLMLLRCHYFHDSNLFRAETCLQIDTVS